MAYAGFFGFLAVLANFTFTRLWFLAAFTTHYYDFEVRRCVGSPDVI